MYLMYGTYTAIRHRVSPEFIGSQIICIPMAFPAESLFKENQNTSRPSEHPLVRGEKCQNVQVGLL